MWETVDSDERELLSSQYYAHALSTIDTVEVEATTVPGITLAEEYRPVKTWRGRSGPVRTRSFQKEEDP